MPDGNDPRRGGHRPWLAAGVALTLGLLVGGLLGVRQAAGGGKSAPRASHPAARPHTPPQTPLEMLRGLSPGASAGPPLILTYHAISNGMPSKYTVRPSAFAAQLRLLAAAGYHPITAMDLLGYLRGKPLPPRPVMLTFDDGISTDLTQADPLLARMHWHAVAFIVGGWIGTSQPYYLTWQDVTRLARSGRWDIESHTYLGHGYIQAGNGHSGPFLTTRKWLLARHRQETLAEYERRVSGDLLASRRAIERRGLPGPSLFAYPFGASADDHDPAVTRYLNSEVARLFGASMLDDDGSGATTPAQLAQHSFRRVTVTAGMTLPRFAAQIEAATPLPVPRTATLAQAVGWQQVDGGAGAMRAASAGVQMTAGVSHWAEADYQPARSVFWHDYTVAAKVAGMRPGGTTAGLVALRGSPDQIEVGVSARGIVVRKGLGSAHELHFSLSGGSAAHDISITVRGQAAGVAVDGRRLVLLRLAGPPAAAAPTGGIGLTVSGHGSDPPVLFSQVRLVPLAG